MAGLRFAPFHQLPVNSDIRAFSFESILMNTYSTVLVALLFTASANAIGQPALANATPKDYAHCAAASARKAQVISEAQQVLATQLIGTDASGEDARP